MRKKITTCRNSALHRIKFSVTIKDFFPETAVWMKTQIVVSQKFCETATCDFWDTVVSASSQCESAAKSSFEFHFLHYLVVYDAPGWFFCEL